MDKTKGWEVGMAGVGGMVGEKWRQLYLNNNKKCGEENKHITSQKINCKKQLCITFLDYQFSRNYKKLYIIRKHYGKKLFFLDKFLLSVGIFVHVSREPFWGTI